MKRATPMTVLVAAQALVTLAAALFAFAVVPRLLVEYRDAGAEPPFALTLAGWPLALLAVAALAVASGSATGAGARGPRLRAAAVALTVSGLGLAAVVLGSLAPLFR